MRVGVDIDNTINDCSQSIARELDPVVGKDTEPLLKEHFWIEKAVGWTDEQVIEFFSNHAEKIHRFAHLKDNMTRYMLQGLFRRGVDLFIITNRDNERVGYDIQTCTLDWLQHHEIRRYFSSVLFTPGCKHEYCVTNDIGIDVMVEDSPERAEAFLEAGIPVVLFDYPYNRHVEHEKLYRVNDWWGAFQAIVKIQDAQGKM